MTVLELCGFVEWGSTNKGRLSLPKTVIDGYQILWILGWRIFSHESVGRWRWRSHHVHIILSTPTIPPPAECRGRLPNPTTYASVTMSLFLRNNEYLALLSFAPLFQHLRVATIISGSADIERGWWCWPLVASKLCGYAIGVREWFNVGTWDIY